MDQTDQDVIAILGQAVLYGSLKQRRAAFNALMAQMALLEEKNAALQELNESLVQSLATAKKAIEIQEKAAALYEQMVEQAKRITP